MQHIDMVVEVWCAGHRQGLDVPVIMQRQGYGLFAVYHGYGSWCFFRRYTPFFGLLLTELSLSSQLSQCQLMLSGCGQTHTSERRLQNSNNNNTQHTTHNTHTHNTTTHNTQQPTHNTQHTTHNNQQPTTNNNNTPATADPLHVGAGAQQPVRS